MRDRDVLNAIKEALEATRAFDTAGVWLWDPEDFGEGTSIAAAAWIEPATGAIDDRWDDAPGGGVIVTSTCKITIAARAEDTRLRDEMAENLIMFAFNSLNGQSLAELTLPEFTRFQSWTWLPPTPPERQIACTFSYQYIVEGWNDFDVTE
jgi:hypothetical protein